ncbi:ester cyclase [Micromonospora echinospora]|uniref:ester cyclase n=1 Tax=Micromonospora echinospora TaxID=1877 RepID=UPI003A835E1D
MEEIVRRYLQVFVSGDLDELAAVVAEDVVIHGAGTQVQGRHHVEGAVRQIGLTCTHMEVHELFTAGDRVVVYFTQHLRHDATGRDVTISGLKMYRLANGLITAFWGETDLYGLMRQLGRVPADVTF